MSPRFPGTPVILALLLLLFLSLYVWVWKMHYITTLLSCESVVPTKYVGGVGNVDEFGWVCRNFMGNDLLPPPSTQDYIPQGYKDCMNQFKMILFPYGLLLRF